MIRHIIIFFLKNEEVNGSVPHWHINCAVLYDKYNKELTKNGTYEYKWISNHEKNIKRKLKDFEKAGVVATYSFTDFLVFPESVWRIYDDEILL